MTCVLAKLADVFVQEVDGIHEDLLFTASRKEGKADWERGGNYEISEYQ